MHHILLIDDDPDIVKLNKKYLQSKGYHVRTADNGEKAIQALFEVIPDCIVLDVLLPDVPGYDLCGEIRNMCNTPIIFLSCKDNEDDKINGLLSGGDDYMTKPFSMRELEARIKAQIRRTNGISYDKDNRIIFCRAKSVVLSQQEFDLFLFLYKNKHDYIPAKDLYAALKNVERDESNTVAVYIRRLRKKLEVFGDGCGIETVRGLGYRFHEK